MGRTVIGWLVAGAWLGLEAKAANKRKAERLERRRATPPRPALAWSVYAAVTVVFVVINPATLLVMAGIGIAVWRVQRIRAADHAAWLAERNAAAMPTPRQARHRAREYDQQGMPSSAQAMRDLAAMTSPSRSALGANAGLELGHAGPARSVRALGGLARLKAVELGQGFRERGAGR